MKKHPLVFALVFILSFFSNGKPVKDGGISVAGQALCLIKTVERYHYAPRPVNDSFSAAVYRKLFRLLDPYGLVFTAESVRKLDGFKLDLDDQIKQQKTTFLDAAAAAYAVQLTLVDSLLKVLKARKIDLTESDTLWLGDDTLFSPQSNLLGKWEQWVKYMVLWSYQSRRDSTDTASLPPVKVLHSILEEVFAREDCRIQARKSRSGDIREFTSQQYLKALANTFDPHTEYLSAVEKDRFETDLSKESELFGIRLNFNTAGEMQVSAVQPGGPAWNSNKINEGDILLDIRKGDGTFVDLRCANLSEVQRYLSSIKDGNTEFKIRKKNGKIITVTLKKEIIEVEENTIQSFILKGSSVVGYIYLPSFYTDCVYGQYLSRGCANDLATELIRLKAVPVQGLILDLRSNGGGSMWEAIRMAGSFIDYGALCITHTRGKQPETVKDMARGTVYSGPLIVMVNSFSASASELLAGCLQDHNRAVIIGSTTYGKSTVQQIVPVNAGNFDSLSLYKGDPLGYLTLTINSLYRVTGVSHQKTGVAPDIELPELTGSLQDREASYENALEFPKIKKKAYYFPSAALPFSMLKSLSEKRVKTNQAFNKIITTSESIQRKNSRYPVPLSGRSFAEYLHQFDKLDDTLAEKECPFTAVPPKYSGAKNSLSAQEKTDLDAIVHSIRGDRYITEAFFIMNDLIKNPEKKEEK